MRIEYYGRTGTVVSRLSKKETMQAGGHGELVFARMDDTGKIESFANGWRILDNPIKIVVEIPTEFTDDYQQNKFGEFFERVLADMRFRSGTCGRYERETAEMFLESFRNSTTLSDRV